MLVLTEEQRRLAEANRGLAYSVAWRFIRAGFGARNPGMDHGDIIAAALVGLCKAAARFDPTRGYQFSTYAAPTIAGEIRRSIRECHAGGIRVPRTESTRPLVSSLDTTVEGRDGAQGSLADLVPVYADVAEVVEIREALAALTPRQRRCLALRAAGYTQTEVAAIIGYSQANISRLEIQARQALARALQMDSPGRSLMKTTARVVRV